LGGTPGYMAPEAAAGQPVDKRSDVYSSCVVLAELLTGARLFTTASSLALTHQQAGAAPQLGGIEAPVAAVLTTGLQPRPDDRPADGETLLTRLEAAIEETHGRRWLAAAGLGTIGSTAATIAAGTTLTATTTGATGATTATAAKTGTSTLSRGKVIGAGATVAAVIAVIIAFILSRPEPPHPTATQTTPTPPAAAPVAQATFTGTYLFHFLSSVCSGYTQTPWPDAHLPVTQQGNTIHIAGTVPGGISGPLNADGSFVATGTYPGPSSYTTTWRGVFATEGGGTVIRDGEWTSVGGVNCHDTFVATKQ
jgi:eukaryotic-like serine/threonine-protein kinase